MTAVGGGDVVAGGLESDVVVVVTGFDVHDPGVRGVHRVGQVFDEAGTVGVVYVAGVAIPGDGEDNDTSDG